MRLRSMCEGGLLALAVLCICGTGARGQATEGVLRLEAEAAERSGGVVEVVPTASGARCVGGMWGADAAHWLEVTWTFDRPRDCVLGVTYAYDAEQFGRRFPGTPARHALKVTLDGYVADDRLEVSDTADWGVFTTVTLRLGRLTAGAHILRLAPVAPANDVNIDCITVGGADYKPEGRTAVGISAASRHFRLRLSPRADAARFHPSVVLAFLEAQHAYLRGLLGQAPTDVIPVTLIAAADWARPGASAYHSRGVLYLQERESATPGGNYAHEMYHAFEEGLGLPTWWSEGMAFLTAWRSDVEIYGRAGAGLDAAVPEMSAWWEQAGRKQMVRADVNVVRWWGTSRLPAGTPSADLYRAANLPVVALWRQEGDAFFARLYARLRADRRETADRHGWLLEHVLDEGGGDARTLLSGYGLAP